MPTEWKARLDGRGYHAISVKRVSTAARWDGPTRTARARSIGRSGCGAVPWPPPPPRPTQHFDVKTRPA